LQLVLGNLHDYRGHYREAIATYEQILRNNGESLLARNNLAWLLALHAGQGVEALEEIQKAIDLGGPLPELLDTRAVIYLALRRTDKAIEDLGSSLEQVSGASTSTANRKFHLARAHWSRNEKTEAKRAFAEAKSAGLQETGLHPLELPAFRRLVKEMN
jgi:tetratricopeptide (TPR) repeat protein